MQVASGDIVAKDSELPRRLKIALVTTFYPPHNFGGDGIYVRRLAHALHGLGCNVTVIYDSDAYRLLSPTKKEPAPLDEPEGLKVIALRSAAPLASMVLTQQAGRPIVHGTTLDALLSDDFDVVHYHNISLVGGPGLLSLGTPRLRIYTAHEHWLVCPTHILWQNNERLCETKTCLSCQIKYKRPPQLWRMTNLLKKEGQAVDAFIALSQSSADNHARFGFPFPMRVMPSFLPDLEEADTRPPHPNGSRPFLFFAGRLEAIKGLQDILPHIDASFPCDLLIAGDGAYEADLKRMVRAPEKVRFLGRLAPDALPAYYAHALALLAPSICYEVFPLVALEAFRSRLPLLARNLGSYPEIISASGGGLLFETGHDLKAAVTQIINDPPLRQRMADAGRKAFEDKWSIRASLSALFDLIGELAEKKGAGRVKILADNLKNTVLSSRANAETSARANHG
jgi:glycosyltransferase involved in cell wall biosynthesis